MRVIELNRLFVNRLKARVWILVIRVFAILEDMSVWKGTVKLIIGSKFYVIVGILKLLPKVLYRLQLVWKLLNTSKLRLKTWKIHP